MKKYLLNVKAFMYLIIEQSDRSINDASSAQILKIKGTKSLYIKEIKSNLERVINFDLAYDPHTNTYRDIKMKVIKVDVDWVSKTIHGFSVNLEIEVSPLTKKKIKHEIQNHDLKRRKITPFSMKSAEDAIIERLDNSYSPWVDMDDNLLVTFFPIGSMWEEIAGITNLINVKKI